MPKTYPTLTDVATGDVLTASAYNNLLANARNMRVPPACSVYFGTATTYTQDTDIPWTAEDFANTDGMWTSGATVTIQTAGLYLVTFSGRLTSTSSSSARALVLFSGATTDLQGQAETTSDFRWAISCVRSLAALSTLTARVQGGGLGTITLQGNTDLRPTLTATWLGQVS